MILKFGKYKGFSLQEVFDEDELYIEWLYNNHDSELIRNECYNLLYSENDLSKIESIILHSLIKVGYSESEANIFIKKLKSN